MQPHSKNGLEYMCHMDILLFIGVDSRAARIRAA